MSVKRWHALLLVVSPIVAWAACGSEDESEVPSGIWEMYDEYGTLAWTQIGSNTGQPVVTGSTAGAANEYAPPCSEGNGSDLSYRWTAPSGGSFTFNTQGSSLDTVLHIYNWSTMALLGCNDDINDDILQSTLTLNLTDGQELRIVVDSYGSKGGAFQLNVIAPCGPPPNECLGPGTWNGTSCTYPPKPNGTACNDGNACTETDTCQSGTCTGSNPKVCQALSQCHNAGTCNPATGACSNPAKPNGATCNDGNECTQTDTCQSGTCTGSNPKVCQALSQCHNAGTCNPATGTCSNPAKPAGASCSDGLSCTSSDGCNGAGTCQSGSSTCGSGYSCTTQGCVSTGNCYLYKCPSTGKSYDGATDYQARHRCELICGDFCTFVDNVCD